MSALDWDLTGRVALVTGASAGIGEAVARRLAARGAHLFLGARRVERCQELAAELAAAHDLRAEAAPLDVRDEASVDAWVAAARAFAGDLGPAVLINNAGLALGMARLTEATREDEADWETMLDTNVMGLLRVTRRLLPALGEAERSHVVNIGSLAGVETYEGGSVYCASKAAVAIISEALRFELLGTGVRVCCIQPGLVETEFSVVRLRDDQANDKVYQGMTPLTADDVARAVEWVVTQPGVTNIETLRIQPVDQASAQRVHRRG